MKQERTLPENIDNPLKQNSLNPVDTANSH